jgi:hypothetical protein
MTKFWKKQREWSEILDDPRTPYMIGRLLGVNEVIVALPDTQDHVRKVVEQVLGYFMEDELRIPRREVGVSEPGSKPMER